LSKEKVTRRKYLKYAGGAVIVAAAAVAGAAYLTIRPSPSQALTKTATVSLAQLSEAMETSEVVTIVTTVSPQESKLEIFDWWTADYEREAANAMFQTLGTLYPDVIVIENPTIGGGKASPQEELQARLTAGLPPDTWQMTAGAELKGYMDEGYLQPVDDLWSELNYSQAVPKPLANMVTLTGHEWAIPLNVHFQDVLYYDAKLFGQAGLTPPTDFEELMKVADAVRQAISKPESAPIALGTEDKLGAGTLFDAIFLEVAGPEHYVDFYKGLVDPTTDAAFKTTLENLTALVSNVYSDHTGLTWKQSCDMLISGTAGMVIAGTEAINYFVSKGWVPGENFGAVVFPQKPETIFLGHSTAYGSANGAPHPQACKDWLRAVASADLQKSAIVKEGGLFARLDIDPGGFPDPIRRGLQSSLGRNPGNLILDQLGGIAPFQFSQAYWDVIIQFLLQTRYVGYGESSITKATASVAALFEQYNVKQEAAWYQWSS
jgi:glucose/mannose transport system substrate-binding protein